MAESYIKPDTAGLSPEEIKDQYADGKAAKVWEEFIGGKKTRTSHYREFLCELLRKRGCKRILDVACGTGVDSMMLCEEGFDVTSVDASDKMLKYALESRWERRKEPAFDQWVIKEANWLTLPTDIEDLIGDGFDAIICIGNSFPHMPDSTGENTEHRIALKNFEKCLKPTGLLLIDHRNFDQILDKGATPSKGVYYNSEHIKNLKTSILYVNSKPNLVVLDHTVNSPDGDGKSKDSVSKFRFTYYPHRLEKFSELLMEAFDGKARHTIYGDFKLLKEVDSPAFYIHLVEKQLK